MNNIKTKAQELIDENLILCKPIAYQIHQQQKINEYWDLHGKEVVRQKLIKTFRGLNEYYKLEYYVNPTDGYIIEPIIKINEILINELEFI
jgi:hypothetical protein